MFLRSGQLPGGCPFKLVPRVALFSHTSGLDGAGRAFVDLVVGLTSSGCECLAIVPGRGKISEVLRDASVPVFESRNIISWHWTSKGLDPVGERAYYNEGLNDIIADLVPVVNKYQINYIISNTMTSPVGLAIAELLGIHSAVSVREYGDADHSLDLLYGLSASMRAMYISCTSVFCVTGDVLKYHFGSDPLRKCSTIYSDININRYDRGWASKTNDTILSAIFPFGGYTILLPATISAAKGQLELLEAARILNKEGFKVNCVFAGVVNDANYLISLEEQIKSSGSPRRYAILPFQPSIYSLIAQADCVVSCSRYEAFSRTLIEASILEVPIVYPDAPGTREAFKDPEHGLSYQRANVESLVGCLRRNLLNPAEAKARARKARGYCLGRFTTRNYAGAVLERIHQNLTAPVQPRSDLLRLIFGEHSNLLVPTWRLTVVQVDGEDREVRRDSKEQTLGEFEFLVEIMPAATYLRVQFSALLPIALEQLKVKQVYSEDAASDIETPLLTPLGAAPNRILERLITSISLFRKGKTSSLILTGSVHRVGRRELAQAFFRMEGRLRNIRNAVERLFNEPTGMGAQLIKMKAAGRPILLCGMGKTFERVGAYLDNWRVDVNYRSELPQYGKTPCKAASINPSSLLEPLVLEQGTVPYIVFAITNFSDEYLDLLPQRLREIEDYIIVQSLDSVGGGWS